MAEQLPDLQAVPPAPATKTHLDLINECDNFPYADTDPESYTSHISTYYHLFIPPCPQTLGYLLPSVALTLQGIKGWTVNETDRTIIMDLPSNELADKRTETMHDSEKDAEPLEVETTANPATLERARTELFTRTATAMRNTGHFAVLQKWRDELYPIYWRDPQSDSRSLLASVERAASPLFGIVSYGVHMTAYSTSPDGSIRIWVARRAATKQTYAGLLDQTVAGGIATGETAQESLIREAEEEASIRPEIMKRKVKAAGAVSYFHIRDSRAGGETRLLQPECQFVYDLDLTGEDVEPRSGDEEEVEGFTLMSIDDVKNALGRGEFKPNCALVILDFFVRHGILTRENEPDYCEIVSRLRRKLEFPVL